MKDLILVYACLIIWFLTSIIGSYISYLIMTKKDAELNNRLYNHENTTYERTIR